MGRQQTRWLPPVQNPRRDPLIRNGNNNENKAGRIGRPVGTTGRNAVIASVFDGVDALSVALGGPHLQAQFLLQMAADETTYAVCLPACRAHDGAQSGSFGLLQQRDHLRRLGVFPPCRSRAAAGPVLGAGLVRRHLPPLCASGGLQVLNGFPNPSGGYLPAGGPFHLLHTPQAIPVLPPCISPPPSRPSPHFSPAARP